MNWVKEKLLYTGCPQRLNEIVEGLQSVVVLRVQPKDWCIDYPYIGDMVRKS